MLQILRLQLGNGMLDGKTLADTDALPPTHVPKVIPGPLPSPARRASFHGYDWNVS